MAQDWIHIFLQKGIFGVDPIYSFWKWDFLTYKQIHNEVTRLKWSGSWNRVGFVLWAFSTFFMPETRYANLSTRKYLKGKEHCFISQFYFYLCLFLCSIDLIMSWFPNAPFHKRILVINLPMKSLKEIHFLEGLFITHNLPQFQFWGSIMTLCPRILEVFYKQR